MTYTIEDYAEEEAVEFIDYNTLRAIPYMGDKAPIVVYLDFLMMGDSCTQQ